MELLSADLINNVPLGISNISNPSDLISRVPVSIVSSFVSKLTCKLWIWPPNKQALHYFPVSLVNVSNVKEIEITWLANFNFQCRLTVIDGYRFFLVRFQ